MEEMQRFLKDFPHISFREDWNIPADVQYALGGCEAIVQALRYLPLAPSVRAKMLEVSLVKGAMATTAIEGNTLTEEEVLAIHEGRSSIPQSRKYLEHEVRNVLDALNAIQKEVVESHAISPVTPDMIRAFNAQVGKELGSAFESVPGEFRPCEVVVGTYRAPDHRAVKWLIERMCDWLRREFSYEQESRPEFANGVIEAIVAHVYLVWIHPFADGNGRTARLLEFYLLLRGGLPNTCAHILSNHYNKTRSEYYRQLSAAGRTRDLTEFIRYAVMGLRDGLAEVLEVAQRHQIESCWRNYVYDRLDGERLTRGVHKRYARLLTNMDVFSTYTRESLQNASTEVAVMYGKIAKGTLLRDIRALCVMELIDDLGNDTYSVHTGELLERLPKERSFGADSAITSSAHGLG